MSHGSNQAEAPDEEKSADVLQQAANLGAAVDALMDSQNATLGGGSTGRVVIVDLDAEEMLESLQRAIEGLCTAVSHLLDVTSNLQVVVRVREQLEEAYVEGPGEAKIWGRS